MHQHVLEALRIDLFQLRVPAFRRVSLLVGRTTCEPVPTAYRFACRQVLWSFLQTSVHGRFVCRGDHRLGLVSIRVFLVRALAPFQIAFELQQPFCEVVRAGVVARRRRVRYLPKALRLSMALKPRFCRFR